MNETDFWKRENRRKQIVKDAIYSLSVSETISERNNAALKGLFSRLRERPLTTATVGLSSVGAGLILCLALFGNVNGGTKLSEGNQQQPAAQASAVTPLSLIERGDGFRAQQAFSAAKECYQQAKLEALMTGPGKFVAIAEQRIGSVGG